MPEQDSIAHANELAQRASVAAATWRGATQEQVDRVCEAMSAAGIEAAQRLGRLAREETGYGRADHKTVKNLFCARDVWDGLRSVRTVGVIGHDAESHVIEIAEPVGVVAALVPVTNPTATTIFKSLIAAKTRNAIVLAPHPRGRACTGEAARVMQEAAQSAGAPPDLIQAMSLVSVAGTDALMRSEHTDLVLATGSRAMVLAAYSSGKPTFAVGPGNVPAYIHASADIPEAARCITLAKQFDWGVLCSSEQSAIVDREVASALRAEVERHGALFLSDSQQNALLKVLFPQGNRGAPNVEAVGQSPATLAHLAGFAVPPGTTLLVVRPGGIGYDYPFSREILGPVFKWIEVDGPDQGIATAEAQLRFGGEGHSASVHARDESVIARYGERVPAYRVVVNTSSMLGAAGGVTGLERTYMIGTGTAGGSVSSDNISWRQLINRKRLASPTRPWSFPEASTADLEIAPWALARTAAPAAPSGRNGVGSDPTHATPSSRPATPAAVSLEELVRQAMASVMADA